MSSLFFGSAGQGVQHVCMFLCECLAMCSQATDRDLDSSNTMKRVIAWICALLTTDRDPASVIPDSKRKYVTTVIFHGPIVFGIDKSRNYFSLILHYLRNGFLN